jgi:hypothetical protein
MSWDKHDGTWQLLGTALVEAVLGAYGRSEVVTRLSDPLWL